jgi:hypothetical protein
MSLAMPRFLGASAYALLLILPPLVLTLLAAALFALLLAGINQRWRPVAPTGGVAPANPTIGDLVRLAIAFGGFGYVLGFFLAVSDQLLVISIAGTVTSAGVTYLALLYGKDAIQNSPRILTAALVNFFVSFLMTLEYTRSYLGLAGG